jgi:hypothetical protein
MAYSDFTLERVENELGVTVVTIGNLFGAIEAVAPSEWLVQTLERLMPLALRVNSEKARIDRVDVILGILMECIRSTL